MSDPAVLGAVSLMVSAIGLTLSLWRNDIDAARQVRVAPMPADRLPAIAVVRSALWRTIVLATIAWLLAACFLPPVAGTLRHWTLHPYNPVATAFLIVYAVAVMLAIVALQSAIVVGRKLRQLRQKGGTNS